MSRRRYALSAAARVDLLHVWNYLAENASFDVADKTIAQIQRGIAIVARTPGYGHRREDLTDRDLRVYRVGSYLIVYRTDTKPLHVIRVVHASRNIKKMLREQR